MTRSCQVYEKLICPSFSILWPLNKACTVSISKINNQEEKKKANKEKENKTKLRHRGGNITARDMILSCNCLQNKYHFDLNQISRSKKIGG